MLEKSFASLTALAVASLWSSAALAAAPAADAPVADVVQPGEIVVTAQKRSESINRVPLSIVAASGDQLKSVGITNTSDLGRIVTGFQAIQTQNGTPVYYLRGVGYNDISVAARPSVTLYSDEAPLPYGVMSLGQTVDLERVEVLKGPQGTLFGSNSTGGAINFVAAKPTSTFQAGFDGSFGRFNDNTESGFISGPLASGIKGRLAVEHDGGGAWQYDALSGRKNGVKNVTSGRLTLDAEPTDNLKLAFTASGTIDKSDPQQPQFVARDPAIAAIELAAYGPNLPIPASAFPAGPPNNARVAGFDTTGPDGVPFRKDDSQWQIKLRADYNLASALTLTSLTSYAKVKQRYAVDGDGTSLDILKFGVVGHIRAFSQELRLSGNAGDKLKYIIGGNIESDKTSETNTYDIVGQLNGFTILAFGLPNIDSSPNHGDSKFNSQAVFANGEYNISDKLTAHAGVRYTATKSDFDGCSEIGTTPGGATAGYLLAGAYGINPSFIKPGACQTLQHTRNAAGVDIALPVPQLFVGGLKEHNVSWRAGLDYKPVAHTLLYASVSRGYKAGTFSLIGSVDAAQLAPVPQEKLTDYEIGVKSDLIERVLHVNSAVFYYDYANKQTQGSIIDPIFGVIQRLVSIPKSRVWGAELEASLRPAAGLSLNGSVSYVNSKINGSFLGTTQFGVPGVQFQGSAFPNTPRWSGNANAEYRAGVSPTLDAYVGGGATFRSHTNGDFLTNPFLAIPGYAIFDARLGVASKDGQWLFEIYGHNITNKYYWNTQERPGDTIIRFAGEPVTYGARVSLKFH